MITSNSINCNMFTEKYLFFRLIRNLVYHYHTKQIVFTCIKVNKQNSEPLVFLVTDVNKGSCLII